MLGCMHALLVLATANTELDVNGRTALQHGAAKAQGHTATAELIRQHAAPPQPAAAAPAAPPDTSDPAESSPASLPVEIYESAERGELQKVVKWLRKGGSVDAFYSYLTGNGRRTALTLLHAAAADDHLDIVRELLKRGASVDLPSSTGSTALMIAARYGHLPILHFLLQHSANPDVQSSDGFTALLGAAIQGHEACVQALLRAKANTELLNEEGRTALQYANIMGHTAIAQLIRQHASRPSLGLGVTLCAVLPLTWFWVVVLSGVLGTIATIAFSRTLMARPGQQRAARQRRPHRSARHAKAQGRTSTEEPIRQDAAPPQQAAAAVATQATHAEQAAQAAQAARADGAMEEPPVEEEAEQANEGQARSKRPKKKKPAGRAAAAGDEPSEAPLPAASAPPPTAEPKPVTLAAERAEAVLRAAIAGGGLSTLEAALTAAPREVREGGVGAEAQAQCDRLLEAQQEAEREAEHEAEQEAARLPAAERVRESAAQEATRVAAASKAREVAVAAAAAMAAAVEAAMAAEVEATALERATADGGESGSSGAAGPGSVEASEAAVPDQFMCSITAEIMTDPVNTVCRTALAIGNPLA
jgi:hypothetical protein